jgi:hypothetical protein
MEFLSKICWKNKKYHKKGCCRILFAAALGTVKKNSFTVPYLKGEEKTWENNG